MICLPLCFRFCYGKRPVRKLNSICIGLLLCWSLVGVARAETYQLDHGETLTGEIVSYNENGLIVRLPSQKYSERIPWTRFSQDDLKKLAKNPKIEPLVQPFIEVTQKQRIQKTEVSIKPVPRLSRPDVHSLFGALFSSSVGIFLVLLVYGANVYAGYEVAIFRAQPVGLVCGLAAIPALGFLVPIIFLSMPTRVKRSDDDEPLEPAVAGATFSVPGTPPPEPEPAPQAPGGLRLAQSRLEWFRCYSRNASFPARSVYVQSAILRNQVSRLLRDGSTRRRKGHGPAYQSGARAIPRQPCFPDYGQRNPSPGAKGIRKRGSHGSIL